MLLLSLPLAAHAHHSRAAYEQKVSVLEGELVEFRWRNPHPTLSLKVNSENNQSQIWRVEGWGSIYALRRSGVTKEHFRIGDRIKVAGHRSTLRPGDFLGTNVLLPDGTEVVFRRDASQYWTSKHIGSRETWNTLGIRTVDAAAENRGIFRVWSYPTPEYATRHVFTLTEAGKQGKSEWNEQDNFLTRCEQKGMPSSMTTPHPYEFIDEGDTIKIRGYEFDVVRTVHMNTAIEPDSQPASRQGFSVGRWEGNTLVIRTSRINWPWFDMFGTPQSETVEVIERYTLSEDQGHLGYHITVTDPVNFTGPATMEYYWLALGEMMDEPYQCEIH